MDKSNHLLTCYTVRQRFRTSSNLEEEEIPAPLVTIQQLPVIYHKMVYKITHGYFKLFVQFETAMEFKIYYFLNEMKHHASRYPGT